MLGWLLENCLLAAGLLTFYYCTPYVDSQEGWIMVDSNVMYYIDARFRTAAILNYRVVAEGSVREDRVFGAKMLALEQKLECDLK